MNLFERILCRLFPHLDICGSDGTVYLRRWFLCPRRPQDNKLTRRLYLHKFYRGDQDPHLHDHPWPFRSLILKGGYWEHSFNPAWQRLTARYKDSPDTINDLETELVVLAHLLRQDHWLEIPPFKTIRKWYGPGSIVRRGAAWAHKVELRDNRPCWTLFLTGPKERSWGFHTEKGWCPHRQYEHGLCWCYDQPSNEEKSTHEEHQK